MAGLYHGLGGCADDMRAAMRKPGPRASVGLPTWLPTRCSCDAGEYAVVLWRQRGSASDGRKLDLPAVSIYKMRDGKIVESRTVPRRHEGDSAILRRRAMNAHALERVCGT